MIASAFCLSQNALPAYTHEFALGHTQMKQHNCLRVSEYCSCRFLRSILILNFEFICLKSSWHKLSLGNQGGYDDEE